MIGGGVTFLGASSCATGLERCTGSGVVARPTVDEGDNGWSAASSAAVGRRSWVTTILSTVIRPMRIPMPTHANMSSSLLGRIGGSHGETRMLSVCMWTAVLTGSEGILYPLNNGIEQSLARHGVHESKAIDDTSTAAEHHLFVEDIFTALP